jgi:hypothetical protein
LCSFIETTRRCKLATAPQAEMRARMKKPGTLCVRASYIFGMIVFSLSEMFPKRK